MSKIIKILLFVVLLFNLNNLEAGKLQIDTMPPQTIITKDCGKYTVRVTELSRDSDQIDKGVKAHPVLITHNNRSYNISDVNLNNDFIEGKANYDFSFTLNVLDKYSEANALFIVIDESDNQNIKYDSIRYKPELIEFVPGAVTFGPMNINTSKILSALIKNITDFSFHIKNIKLKYGTVFKIVENIQPDYFLVDSNDFSIGIQYTPTSTNNQKLGDVDSIIIETNCLRYAYPVFGKGVEPIIYVEDVDFGVVEIGNKICKNKDYNPEFGAGLKIHNIGSGFLNLLGYCIADTNSPFKFYNDKKINLNNFMMTPGTVIYVNEICFEPKIVGEFATEIVFKSNSSKVDSIAKLHGYGFLPGINLTPLDFYGIRVASSYKDKIKVRNSSKTPIELTRLEIVNGNESFSIMYNELNEIPSRVKPIMIYPKDDPGTNLKELILPIEFIPLKEYGHNAKIIAEYKNKDGRFDTVFNFVKGSGWVPRVQTTNYNFNPRILVNEIHPDTAKITIKSISDTRDLTIFKVEILKNLESTPEDFIFLKSVEDNIVLTQTNELKIPVLFRPLSTGSRKVILNIITNAINPNNIKLAIDTTQIVISGESFNRVITSKPVKFDSILNCNTSSGKLNIENVSNNKTAVITSFNMISGDVLSFDVNYNFSKFPITLQPGQNIDLPVKFTPIGANKINYQAYAKIVSNIDTCNAYFSANTFKKDIIIHLDTLNDMYPGMITIDKNAIPDKEMKVSLYGDNIGDVDIRNVILELTYSKKNLRFAQQIELGDLLKFWSIKQAQESIISPDKASLIVELEGTEPISSKGVLFKIGFIILLGDSNTSTIDIKSAQFGASDRCITPSLKPGIISLSYCGIDLRNILNSGIPYQLVNLSTDYSEDNTLKIEYSVGIESTTTLELFTQYGELVKIIDSGFKTAGNYYLEENLGNISSGVYFLTIKSGPYHQSEKVLICK